MTESSEAALGCDVWEDQPTLVVQRDTFANFFHGERPAAWGLFDSVVRTATGLTVPSPSTPDSEDFFNVFVALAVLQWSTDDLQMVIADLYPKGPFWDMWSRVFAGRRPPLTAWDLKKRYGKSSRVCYRNLALGIYGPASPITVASWRTPCKRTPLVRAYADIVVRGLGLQHKTHYAQPTPPTTIMVTYMARRASSQWPERRFCDSQASFFKCEEWQHLDKRSLGRMIKNDGDVVATLRKLESRSWPSGAAVKVINSRRS